MNASFLDQIRDVDDPPIPEMVLYPLVQVLLTVLVAFCAGRRTSSRSGTFA